MPVVHTIDLVLLDANGRALPRTPTLVIGQRLAVELRVTHTRAWDATPAVASPTSKAASAARRVGGPIDFVWEIDADSDDWLVGGRRRAHFAAMVHSARRAALRFEGYGCADHGRTGE